MNIAVRPGQQPDGPVAGVEATNAEVLERQATPATGVSESVQDRVLALVADWLGQQGFGPWICGDGRAVDRLQRHVDDGSDCTNGGCGPAPTGREAFRSGDGPMLIPDWSWPDSGPTPAIVLEGGPRNWPTVCQAAVQATADREGLGVLLEPYSSFGMRLYPAQARP